jgi:GT2 family glycosyltransferase
MKNSTVDSLTGFIDEVSIDTSLGNSYVKVSGWVMNLERAWIDIKIGIKNSDNLHSVIRCKRPDIQNNYPHIAHSRDCGFVAYIPVADGNTFKYSNICLIIQTKFEDGSKLEKKVELAIPNNDCDNSYSIFDNSNKNFLKDITEIRNQSFKDAYKSFVKSGYSLKVGSNCTNPDLSVCLVAYNQAHMTLACLKSLASHCDVSYEVILVDNNSDQETQNFYGQLKGNIKIIRLKSNVHYLLAMNHAIKIAKGKYTLLLNNDVQLEQSCLNVAINKLSTEKDLGILGGKLIRPDGLLQEAGSITWKDGSTSGYGVGQDPSLPEFNFTREVDYISGALLFSYTNLLKQIGLFDQRFAPAYYEDADLCIRVKKLGLKVLYDPKIIGVHFEKTSSKGSNFAKEQIIKNKNIFFTKHQDYLSNRVMPNPYYELYMRESLPRKNRVLYIDDFIPNPKQGQGQPRMLSVLSTLHNLNFQISLFATNSEISTNNNFFSHEYVEVYASKEKKDLYSHLFERDKYYDFIVVSRPHNLQILSDFFDLFNEIERPIIIYDSEAIFALREISKKQVLENINFTSNESKLIIEKEIIPCSIAESIITVSESEADIIKSMTDIPVFTAGCIYSPKVTHSQFHDRSSVVSLGPILTLDSPNTDSLRWFLNNIHPYLNDIDYFHIGNVNQEILNSEFLEHADLFVGEVDNLDIWLSKARVFVAPHRYAAGKPLKVLEATAHGLPSVISPLLARQLGWDHENQALIANTKEEYLEQIYRLHSCQLTWQKLRANAMKDLLEKYSADKFQQEFSLPFKYFLQKSV